MMQTVNERLRDESIAHAVWISRYSTGVAARMVKILNDSDAELTARLLIALDSLDPGSFTVKRLESLLASVREVTPGDSNIINDNARRLHHYFSLFPALIPCTSVLVVTFRRSIYVGTGPFSVLREST